MLKAHFNFCSSFPREVVDRAHRNSLATVTAVDVRSAPGRGGAQNDRGPATTFSMGAADDKVVWRQFFRRVQFPVGFGVGLGWRFGVN